MDFDNNTPVPIPASALQWAIRFLDTFRELYRYDRVNLAGYVASLNEIGSDVVEIVDERCAMKGFPNAHDDHEHEFMSDASDLALEIASDLTDALYAVGIDDGRDQR